MKKVIKLLATGFYTGYIPRAEGTVASFLASLIWVFFYHPLYYPVLTAVIILGGFFAADYAEKYIYQQKDSSKIVIDEIAGMLVVYLGFSFTWGTQGLVYYIAGFFIFRALDIIKPPPVKNLQSLAGGVGVMADDLLSGVVSNALLQVIRFSIFHEVSRIF
ncbi:MAG: phosphatidylglycerophosphatase A [Spirochaetota bacterium]